MQDIPFNFNQCKCDDLSKGELRFSRVPGRLAGLGVLGGVLSATEPDGTTPTSRRGNIGRYIGADNSIGRKVSPTHMQMQPFDVVTRSGGLVGCRFQTVAGSLVCAFVNGLVYHCIIRQRGYRTQSFPVSTNDVLQRTIWYASASLRGSRAGNLFEPNFIKRIILI